LIEHKHSDYCFAWHYHYVTAKFDSGKLYKVARAIIASNKPGSKRLRHILHLLGKNLSTSYDDAACKYPRELDMLNRVAAVKAAVASKTPLSFFDNPQMSEYLRKLDPKHSPPYRLERTQILEVMMDIAMKELAQMLTERREQLHDGFVSGTSISGLRIHIAAGNMDHLSLISLLKNTNLKMEQHSL
jgi:hypothetical protein